MTLAPETLLSVLVHIQANLDGDLDLANLSRKAGLSPSRFHRLFKASVGETPRDHVARLRVERGAFRLSVQDASLVQIALDCGFNNHETFTRAFRRAYALSPSAYRRWSQQQISQRNGPARGNSTDGVAPFELSASKIVRLREMHLAFVRHVGPYESVPDTLFTDLENWALRAQVTGPRVWLGLGHDAPGATAPERLRFDAALVVPNKFVPEGRIGWQVMTGGDFLITTHVGGYDTLPAAYAEIFQRLQSRRDCAMAGLPVVEIYRSGKVDTRLRINETDICIPVTRRSGASRVA